MPSSTHRERRAAERWTGEKGAPVQRDAGDRAGGAARPASQRNRFPKNVGLACEQGGAGTGTKPAEELLTQTESNRAPARLMTEPSGRQCRTKPGHLEGEWHRPS